MLSVWHSRKGKRGATYRALATGFYKAKRNDLVDTVVDVCRSGMLYVSGMLVHQAFL